jgi:pyruvate,orthophosphate dikinase
MSRYVFYFEEGSKDDRSKLGGKGAGLSEMSRIGLPVPPGFTITTEACIAYQAQHDFPEGLLTEVTEHLAGLEQRVDKVLGDPHNPLLVSVRSGAPISMPGMMDTVLNLGLNRETAEGLGRLTENRRFALDSFRRFIQMFGNVVLHMDHDRFEAMLQKVKDEAGVVEDQKLDENGLMTVIDRYLAVVHEATGEDFPEDPKRQLELAIRAVFDSWNNPRAQVYRRINKIPDTLGTAVNVQMMAFGNMGDTSGTGVLFTRDPNTGAPGLYGEFLTNAQGEDVVAGIRTPRPISDMVQVLPRTYQELTDTCHLLERHYRDVQDIEFTVERERLFVLQTRGAKRTARAAVKIAVDLVDEGILTREEAVARQDAEQVRQLLYRQIDPGARVDEIARGLPASPGAAAGVVVFDADEAERRGNAGEKVILVRPETTPDDIHGLVAAQGVLTSRGGMTSHAAIVARGMGKPAVTGCDMVRIDAAQNQFVAAGRTIKAGDIVTIDGATGRVIAGEVPTVEPTLFPEFETLLRWSDEIRSLGVEANADTPEDAERARAFGAEGVGLCRTEHMFMGTDRLPVVQEMILAETVENRKRALERLLPMQEEDFYGILRAMDGLPVTIRLLDPPLHEFLPDVTEVSEALRRAEAEGRDDEAGRLEQVLRRATALQEFNPMLGFRGVRLGIVYPEIYAMQARAIFRAEARLLREGLDPHVEVMIPLVGVAPELAHMAELVRGVNQATAREMGVELPYKIGTMIEVPRAALVAGEIAQTAEFFSFGTNDLTQTTFGYSRDDAESKFLPTYLADKVLADNPFVTLDTAGVGRLIQLAVAEGRAARDDLRVGICGEHGGDPASIEFCHTAGLDYVSCSPYRVPIARLAAAQATLGKS